MKTVNIKRLIFDKSLNQRVLAQIMGCQQSEVSLFANGKRDINEKQLAALIDYFGEDVINDYSTPNKPFEGIAQTAEITILSPDTVEDMRKEVREEIEEVESFPVLPEDVTTSPNTDILK